MLGGDDLRDFLASLDRRLFLTELRASYTRVASGSTWTRTPRGWRRRRFSELDPVRLAALLEVVPDEDRPGVYRRLGAVCSQTTPSLAVWGSSTKGAWCA